MFNCDKNVKTYLIKGFQPTKSIQKPVITVKSINLDRII